MCPGGAPLPVMLLVPAAFRRLGYVVPLKFVSRRRLVPAKFTLPAMLRRGDVCVLARCVPFSFCVSPFGVQAAMDGPRFASRRVGFG